MRLPPKLTVFLPRFTPYDISTEHFCKEFGLSLSESFIKREENGYTLEAKFSPKHKPFINEPRVTTDIKSFKKLRSVFCRSNEEIWTCGSDRMIRLYNLQGEQVELIKILYGESPEDIAVTRRGNLVYSNCFDRSVSIVKNTQIQTVIRLQEWRPRNVCCTASDYFLVAMDNIDEKQTKVVRYYGSTEIQTIQYDDKGQSLFPSRDTHIKHICENRNQDVCVSDYDVGAVVVFDQAGNLRFRYTGPPPINKESACSDPNKRTFLPAGITTDSQSRILIVNYHGQFIHIIDQDGRFLRYIVNCNFFAPWGLCVDSKDNLFVAERGTRKLKKIRYCM